MTKEKYTVLYKNGTSDIVHTEDAFEMMKNFINSKVQLIVKGDKRSNYNYSTEKRKWEKQ